MVKKTKSFSQRFRIPAKAAMATLWSQPTSFKRLCIQFLKFPGIKSFGSVTSLFMFLITIRHVVVPMFLAPRLQTCAKNNFCWSHGCDWLLMIWRYSRETKGTFFNLITLLKRNISLAREIVQLHWFLLTGCPTIKIICFTLRSWSDKLSFIMTVCFDFVKEPTRDLSAEFNPSDYVGGHTNCKPDSTNEEIKVL